MRWETSASPQEEIPLKLKLALLPLLLIGCRANEPTVDDEGGDGDGDLTASGGLSNSSGGNPGNPSGGNDSASGGMGGESSGNGGNSASGGTGPGAGGSEETGVGGDANMGPDLNSGPKQKVLATVAIDCNESSLSTTCNPGSPNPCIPDEPKITCDLVVTDGKGGSVYDGLVGIERRGRSSVNYDKPSYSLEFRKADGSDNPKPCLGMGKEADWILDGPWVDRSLIRNSLALDLFDDMGDKTHYGAESRFATLTVNGDPQGIYRLAERIKVDDDRVDIPADTGIGDSIVLKLDEEGPLTKDMGFFTDRWQVVSPNPPNLSQQAAALSFLAAVEEALEDGTVFEYLEMANVVDWVLLQELTKNVDAYQLSIYFSKAAGKKGNIIPWDFDLSFGQPTISMEDAPTTDSPEGWINNRTDFVDNLFKNPDFKTSLVERWADLRSDRFSDAAFTRRIDEYLVVLSGAALEENFNVWPLENIDFSTIYPPYSLYPVDNHADEIQKLRQFISLRTAWIDENIETF